MNKYHIWSHQSLASYKWLIRYADILHMSISCSHCGQSVLCLLQEIELLVSLASSFLSESQFQKSQNQFRKLILKILFFQKTLDFKICIRVVQRNRTRKWNFIRYTQITQMYMRFIMGNWLMQLWKLSSPMIAAAAAKLLQSCPTLSNPMDHSLPGSSVLGNFQARILEWGACDHFA